MNEYKGINYLRNKLNNRRIRVQTRYKYYEMKNMVNYVSALIPAEYRWITPTLGWCTKAVDSLADRLCFNEFRNDNFGLNEIFLLNNKDVLFDSAMQGALIGSCDFIYISADEDGYPRLQVIDGSNATGIIDPITNMLIEGYAVLQREPNTDVPTLEAYFTAEETTFIARGKLPTAISNPAPYPLLVPIIYRPDAKRQFGHSRISRECMKIQDEALNAMLRMDVTAEFYSFPQKYVLGMEEDAEFNNRAATMSSFLRIDKDSDGDRPVVGQFSVSGMTPHIEQLKMYAALFAGATGLTLDDMGFASGNPASSEAIKAAHENLRLTARKAQRDFSVGFLNAGYLAACVRDDRSYRRNQFYMTKAAWNPIFEPDFSALAGIGDAMIKISQVSPDYLTEEKISDLTGV